MTGLHVGAGSPVLRQVIRADADSPPLKLEAIDALRGLAALYVVAFHLTHAPILLPAPPWAQRFISFGWSGVTLFFIISAFTLALSLQARSDEYGAKTKFYLRRIFRIVPLFLFWLVFRVLRHWQTAGSLHSGSDLLLNVFFLYNFFPGKQEGIVWASWTLGVEMVFYLLFPWLWHVVTRLSRAVIFYIVTLLVAFLFYVLLGKLMSSAEARDDFFVDSLFRHMPTFAVGLVVFWIYHKYLKRGAWKARYGWALITVGVFGYGALISGKISLGRGTNYGQAVVYACIILGLLNVPLRLLVNTITRFYGEISYSVYLNHMIVLNALAPIYHGIYVRPGGTTAHYVLCFLLTLVVLTPLSYGTYRLIEKPGMALGRRLIRRIGAARGDAGESKVVVVPGVH